MKPKFYYHYQHEDVFIGHLLGCDIWMEKEKFYHILSGSRPSWCFEDAEYSIKQANYMVERSSDKRAKAFLFYISLKNDPSVSPNSR